MNSREKFFMMAEHLRVIGEEMLTEFFGERCPKFEPDCVVCERWKLLDDLTANPFGINDK